jgi:hypothetical protein
VSAPGRGSGWTWINGQCHENAIKNGIRKDERSNKHCLEEKGQNLKIHASNIDL